MILPEPYEKHGVAIRRAARGAAAASAIPPTAPKQYPTIPDNSNVAIFSHSGEPTTDMSGPWVPRRNYRRLDVLVARSTGTSGMAITLYKNGVSIGTVSTSATGLVSMDTINADFVANTDVLTVAATTVGTGTTNPTVQVTLV